MTSSKSPTRTEVAEKLRALLSGEITRTEASLWAHPWVTDLEPIDHDEIVWQALERLGGADLFGNEEGEFLYQDEDFQSWLDEVETGKGG